MERVVKISNKQRLKWWHIIVVGSLVHFFSIITITLFFIRNTPSNITSCEVVSFTQRQELMIKEFYDISQELDVTLLKHRQYDGAGFTASYSEGYLYLNENDLDDYCASLDGKWTYTDNGVGELNTFNNKDYKAVRCFSGEDIHGENFGEQVIIYQCLTKAADEQVLVYICKSSYIDDLGSNRRSGNRYLEGHYYDYEI